MKKISVFLALGLSSNMLVFSQQKKESDNDVNYEEVASATEDRWADPRGAYLSAYHASEVYRLLGKRGLTSETTPEVGKAIVESEVGYHIREGEHYIYSYDWGKFLNLPIFT